MQVHQVLTSRVSLEMARPKLILTVQEIKIMEKVEKVKWSLLKRKSNLRHRPVKIRARLLTAILQAPLEMVRPKLVQTVQEIKIMEKIVNPLLGKTMIPNKTVLTLRIPNQALQEMAKIKQILIVQEMKIMEKVKQMIKTIKKKMDKKVTGKTGQGVIKTR